MLDRLSDQFAKQCHQTHCAGPDLLTLDPHGLYLPGGRESICANLYESGSEYYFNARDSWPDTVAPFEALAAACPGTVRKLGLPQSASGPSNAASAHSGKPRPVPGQGPNGFPGSLFRLPLRTEAIAASSEVCKQPASAARVHALLQEFAAAAPEMLVFTRHVRKITVLVVEPDASEATLLGHFTAEHRALPSEAGAGAKASQLTVSGACSAAEEGGSPSEISQRWLKV